jgi:hypothetical protein
MLNNLRLIFPHLRSFSARGTDLAESQCFV